MKKQSHSFRDAFGEQLPNSLVAVMDIMGFSAMMKVNSGRTKLVEECAAVSSCMGAVRHVPSYLSGIRFSCSPKRAKAFMAKVESHLERIIHFQFSDTIVFVLPNIRKNDTSALFSFVAVIAGAVDTCFSHGFPVQCAIEFGDCLWNEMENFFLGKPFIDAHEKADKMGYSGICLSEEVMTRFVPNTARKPKGLDVDSVCGILGIERISAPDKFGAYANTLCVDWKHCRHDKSFDICCFRQELIEQFTAHGKTLTESVVRKIDNTEIVMRQFVVRAKAFRENETLLEAARIPVKTIAGSRQKRKSTSSKYTKKS